MKTLKLAALGLLLAIPLAAQQPDSAKMKHPAGMGMGMGMGQGHDMMGPMMEMMAPMMGIMAYMPDHLLARKDALKLTPDQVTKLTDLQTKAKTAHDAAVAAAKPHFQEMNEAFGKSDTAGVQMHAAAAHDAMGKGHVAELTLATQARALLTENQREQVEQWVKEMQQRMENRPMGQAPKPTAPPKP